MKMMSYFKGSAIATYNASCPFSATSIFLPPFLWSSARNIILRFEETSTMISRSGSSACYATDKVCIRKINLPSTTRTQKDTYLWIESITSDDIGV